MAQFTIKRAPYPECVAAHQRDQALADALNETNQAPPGVTIVYDMGVMRAFTEMGTGASANAYRTEDGWLPKLPMPVDRRTSQEKQIPGIVQVLRDTADDIKGHYPLQAHWLKNLAGQLTGDDFTSESVKPVMLERRSG